MSELSHIDINFIDYNIKDAQARSNINSLLEASVVSGSYNSTNRTIELKNASNVVVSTIPADPFIKDGMVSSVTIVNGNLVISFNTDAGQSPISIQLKDIFDPSNYYNKSDINGYLAGLVATGSYNSATHNIELKNASNVLLATIPADAFIKDGMVSDVSIVNENLVITFNIDSGKSPISIPLTSIFNPSNYYQKSEIDSKIAEKQSEIANLESKIGYYECSSEASSASKTIAASNYVLGNGGSVKIKMQYANTANNATLNINSTGAKPLFYNGERASSTNSWEAGETVEVYYDGTSFYANNVAGGSGSGDGAFDVSAKYPTSGVDGGNTYTLKGALSVLNANLSASKKKGGMSIKFIQSSDNKYVQYRLMATAWSTVVTDWQGVDDEPTAGSRNLAESGNTLDFIKAGQNVINLNNQLGWDYAEDIPCGIFSSKWGTSGSHKVFKIKKGDVIRIAAAPSLYWYGLILKEYHVPVENTAFSPWFATGIAARTGGNSINIITITSDDAAYLCIESTRLENGELVSMKPSWFFINDTDMLGGSDYVPSNNENLVKRGEIIDIINRNVDGNGSVKYAKVKNYTSNSVFFFNHVSLKQGHTYKLKVVGNGFTAPATFNIKVCNKESPSTVLEVARLGGTVINTATYSFTWNSADVDDYRIGVYHYSVNSSFSEQVEMYFWDTWIETRTSKKEAFLAVAPPLNFTDGYYINNLGKLVADTDWMITGKIPCKYNDTLVWASGYDTTNYVISMCVFDKDDNLLTYVSRGTQVSRTWPLNNSDWANASYVVCSFYKPAANGSLSINGTTKVIFDSDAIETSKYSPLSFNDNPNDIIVNNKHKEPALTSVVALDGTHAITYQGKLSLLHFSDIHGKTDNLKRIIKYYKKYGQYLSDIIHTGDTVASVITNDNIFETVTGAGTILNTIGNHEAWLSTSDPDYYATEKQTYDKIFAPSIDNWGVTQPTDAATNGYCYYYKDYTTEKFRLIVLDSVHWHTRNGVSDTNAAQKSWFEGVLADAITNNLVVVCATHYPPEKGITFVNPTGFNEYGLGESGTVGDGWYAKDEMFGCVDTFIGNGGKFAGWIVGHTHTDYFGTVKDHPQQPIVVCTTSQAGRSKDRFLDGTSSQDAFNVISFIYTNTQKMIKLVRIGNDRDIYGRSKNYLCYDVLNAQIIHTD